MICIATFLVIVYQIYQDLKFTISPISGCGVLLNYQILFSRVVKYNIKAFIEYFILLVKLY